MDYMATSSCNEMLCVDSYEESDWSVLWRWVPKGSWQWFREVTSFF